MLKDIEKIEQELSASVQSERRRDMGMASGFNQILAELEIHCQGESGDDKEVIDAK